MIHRIGLVAVAGLLLSGTELAACGDKFLVMGRGTRFQRGSETARTYSVLVYAPPSSQLAEIGRRRSVEKTLRRAGYKPTTVASAGALAETLASGPPHVLLAESGDARAVEQQFVAGRPNRVVLFTNSMSAASLVDAVDEAVDRVVNGQRLSGTKP
jgi:hypothetical protein